MANGCFGCKRQFGCKPYALAQEQAATHCEPLGWIPEQGYRLPNCPLENQIGRNTTKENTMGTMIDTETAKQERVQVAQELRQLEKKYLELTRQAFPEGSEHICTRNGMVKVEVVYVAQAHRVKVRSQTGKEYFVDPHYLQ